MKIARILALFFVFIGLAIFVYVGLFLTHGGFSLLNVWPMGPYLILLCIIPFARTPIALLLPTLAVILIDVSVIYEVFVAPSSSTAALILLWMPVWHVIIVIPILFFVGRLIDKVVKNKKR